MPLTSFCIKELTEDNSATQVHLPSCLLYVVYIMSVLLYVSLELPNKRQISFGLGRLLNLLSMDSNDVYLKHRYVPSHTWKLHVSRLVQKCFH